MGFLDRLATYRRIVEAGSIARAAISLGVSSATASRALSALEQELDTTLIARNTRQMRVTDAGRRFYAHCLRIEREVASARDAVKQGAATGTLTVSVPVSLGLARITPLMPALLGENPGLRVDLRLEDQQIDLVAEGVDIAIRAGAKPRTSASLIARPLYHAKRVVTASPAYLQRRGVPKKPGDLKHHDVLVLANAGDQWRFRRGRTSHAVKVEGPFRSTALLPLRDAAIRSAGVALLPNWMVQGPVARAELSVLLTGYETEGIDVFSLYRVELRRDQRVRGFLSHLETAFARETL